MKKSFILLTFLCCCGIFADLRKNPDSNTLWEIRTAKQNNWHGKGVPVEAVPGGNGFSLSNVTKAPKSPHSLTRKVPLSPEYPYLVFETTSISPYRGYRTWSVSLREMQSRFGSVTNAEPGIVVINCFENPVKVPSKVATLWAYFYNFKADFKYIKMVKKPDNYISVTGQGISERKNIVSGDKVKFTVHLKDPAEEVSLKLLYRSWLYTVKVNGKETVELTPEDKEQKIWSAEIPVQTLVCSKAKTFKKGDILMRAVVLGGSVKTPLWSPLQYPFNGKK